MTKPPAPGYEMVRVGGSQGMPQGFAGQNQMNQLGQFGGASPYGFPPNLASLAGFNPAAFLQQSKSNRTSKFVDALSLESLV